MQTSAEQEVSERSLQSSGRSRGSSNMSHFHHERNAFGYPSAQHESLWQASNNTRSAPIAIVRPPGERPIEPMVYDTDDDDDSVIDVVERDARRLRRKFGYNNNTSSATTSAIHTAATTDAGSSPPPALGGADAGAAPRAATQQAPRAPYLGSLNNAEFVMSLPPISLSGDIRGGLGEPPEVVSYGSLRESHQQRRFLDGPSSYREPSSGRIRQLEHRTRFQTNDARPQMSIGERIQQARSLQEAKNNAAESGVASSLSVLMDEASKTPEFKPTDPVKVMPLIHHVPYRSTFGDSLSEKEYDSPSMLSTSLTAFEVLRSSKGGTLTGHQQNHTQRFVEQQLQQQLQHKEAISIASESQDSHFKPLSRSMSDPTPHVLQRPLPGHTLQQVQSPVTTASNDQRWVPPFSLGNSSGRPAPNASRPMTTTTTTTMLRPMYTYAVAPSPSSVVPPSEPEATFDMDMD